MGVGMVYSKKQDAATMARRGVMLIVMGYALNFARKGIIMIAGYIATGSAFYGDHIFDAMMNLDIFHFSGFVFLLFALMKLFSVKNKYIIILSVLMLVTATFVPQMFDESQRQWAAAGYFFFQNGLTAFPLFSWLIFPASGYCFGRLLQRVENKKRFYGILLGISATAFVLYTVILTAFQYDVTTIFTDVLYGREDAYYRQNIITAPWILLVNGIFYSISYFLSLRINVKWAVSLIHFTSSRMTTFYFIHWIFWYWLFYLVLIKLTDISTLAYIGLSAGIFVCSTLLTFAVSKIIQRPPR